MPEGHVLHRLADGLRTAFAGAPVGVSSPQGRFAEEARLLDGRVPVQARAVGKHLFLEFDDERVVHIHLGLIGRMTLTPMPASGQVPVRGQVRLRLANEAMVADLRGPQGCRLIGRDEVAALEARLGPDPLVPGADPEPARAAIAASTRPIAALLLEQTVMAGVGNVYRAEVLFRAGIDPFTPGNRLDAYGADTFARLWEDIVVQMDAGKRVGRIDTVRPEHAPEAMGRPARVDDHGGEVYVYRRAGQPCHVCGTEVRGETLAGRNLFWCPTCQPPKEQHDA